MSESLPSMRDLLMDERVYLVMAHVALHDGETIHYQTNLEGNYIISCKTHNHGVPIHGIWKGGSNDGSGVWTLPTLGTEVMLGFNDGDFESDPFIVQVFGVDNKPTLVPAQVFVIGDRVEARSTGGVAVPLATKADADGIQAALDGHEHTYLPGGGGATLTTGGPSVPAPQGTQKLFGE